MATEAWTNKLIDSGIGALLASGIKAAEGAAVPAGYCAAVIEADEKFEDIPRGGSGNYPIPLVAVGYGESKLKPIEGGKIVHSASDTFSVFVLFRDRGGAADTRRAIRELCDKIFDALTGLAPIEYTESGGVYTACDPEVELADAWTCRAIRPVAIPAEINKKKLRCMAVVFQVDHAVQPDRDEVQTPDEIEAVEMTFDDRPDESPVTPDDDKGEATVEFPPAP